MRDVRSSLNPGIRNRGMHTLVECGFSRRSRIQNEDPWSSETWADGRRGVSWCRTSSFWKKRTGYRESRVSSGSIQVSNIGAGVYNQTELEVRGQCNERAWRYRWPQVRPAPQ
jgi:hypothetical protein